MAETEDGQLATLVMIVDLMMRVSAAVVPVAAKHYTTVIEQDTVGT